MRDVTGEYWGATRHPWSCLVFVVPLLALYEVGLYCLGPTPVALLRNGADIWLRTSLGLAGVSPTWAPFALLVILLAWTALYREARPHDPVSVWIGMTVESIGFAALLYALGQGLWPVIHAVSGMLEGQRAAPVLDMSQRGDLSCIPEPAVVNLVRYLGAGIYEETLFRLLLFSGLLAAFQVGELPRSWSIGLAGLASALVFAGAHNLGAGGETFHSAVFLFRTLAGAYFAALYCTRGFGIAVGAHAGYDVLIGLLVRNNA